MFYRVDHAGLAGLGMPLTEKACGETGATKRFSRPTRGRWAAEPVIGFD